MSYPPGTRFLDYYRYRRSRDAESALNKWFSMGMGTILIAVGLLFMFLPVLPGILFFIPGLGILVAHSRWVAIVLDKIEMGSRRLLAKYRIKS